MIFGLVNAVLRPIIKIVGCGLYVLTLGLIAIVVNGLLFMLTSWIAGEFDLPFHVDDFWPSAVLGALLVGVVSWLLNMLVPTAATTDAPDGRDVGHMQGPDRPAGPYREGMSEERRGYLYGLIAYVLWGFFPIYFKLLKPSPPLEILAHRVLWSVLFVSLLLAAMRNWRFLGRLRRDRRLLGGITLAGVLIGVNWATYIFGVNSTRVVETALGYFITPLVVVLLGVTVQRERLRLWQWVAVGVGAMAVAVLTVDYGQLPYIALMLAASFGSYSLIKKRLSLPPAEGLFVESAVLAVPALGVPDLVEPAPAAPSSVTSRPGTPP